MPALSFTGMNAVANVAGENLTLLPEKAIWWQGTRTLILADLHFGKAGHFRKSGIAVPRGLEQEDLGVLSDLCRMLAPLTIYIIGDFVHSHLNADWHWLRLWRELNILPEIKLVPGNHDVVAARHFENIGIEFCDTRVKTGPFLLRHYPPVEKHNPEEGYMLSGHVHPAVSLQGKARQSLSFPCFYFGANHGILPAFGTFTGNSRIKPFKSDQVFAVMPGKVICV